MAELKTTVVGSMRKPEYLKIPCWVGNDDKHNYNYVRDYRNVKEKYSKEELENQILRATKDAISIQQTTGIHIGTDGEMRRDNYIYEFCRKLNGFDFQNDVEVVSRGGAWVGRMPQIIEPITSKEGNEHLQVADEWEISQKMSPDMTIKFTLPGPSTIFDTMKNSYYKDKRSFVEEMSKFINDAVMSLVERGCKFIQV